MRVLLALTMLCAACVLAHEKADEKHEWNRLSVNIGGMISVVDANLRVGTKSVAADIDLEDTLGFDTVMRVLKGHVHYRAGESRRHRIELGWYAFHREGRRMLEHEITVGDTTFPIGAEVESFLNLDLYRLSYGYSMIQDDRVDFGASIGLYVSPIKFEIEAGGVFTGYESGRLMAPLPMVGVFSETKLSRLVRLRASLDLFYLEIEQFTGGVVDLAIVAEVQLLRNLAMGLGINALRVKIDAEDDDEDWEGVDMAAEFQFRSSSIFAYLGFTF